MVGDAGLSWRRATFVGESASGWQEVTFDNPVPIEADTTYVASYHAPNGHYASISAAFATAESTTLPSTPSRMDRTGPMESSSTAHQGGSSRTEARHFESANYLVDVVFENT